MTNVDPYTLRERFFRRACPVREVTQAVYHGSPIEGMLEIMRAERLYPQGHQELPDDEFLSVSINDNVLRLFSDGDDLTGFCSTPKLRISHLDPFHNVAATGRSGLVSPGDAPVEWLTRLHYNNQFDDDSMDGATLRNLLASQECHGLAFTHLKWCKWMQFHHNEWNDEAEIALTDRGCDEVWRSLDMLFVEGKEYDDLHEGWRAVAKCAIKKNMLTKADARPLIKRMDEIVEEQQAWRQSNQTKI